MEQAMTQQGFIVELNAQNFQPVLQQSMEKPVVLVCWAAMSPESMEIRTIVEKIAMEYNGAFTLALLDCEQNKELAIQFGIQSIPTLAVFINGQAADGVAGAQTEQAIRSLLAKHLPSAEEILQKQVFQLVQQGEFQQALPILQQLYQQQPENGQVALALTECLIETAQYDQAEVTLATVTMKDQDTQYASLVAKLELHTQAADTPEIRAIEQQLEQDPMNQDLNYQLAIQYSQVNRQQEALELLITILRKDLNALDGEVKKTMIDMLAALGQENPITGQFRRQLYALLY
ncbi:tetratricopeptide repeat protein [Vibrio sp. SS-MA-C1-2]|uniref:tetratricopeptide repeat protein n=1 Tax=Vibrio sp. SS-MA-C1-2 TaxID=2908646 RepID=UPI001F427B45|nr:tetratricopeptide repeat protein [Vibrio sp. SS-MA-C1-2]UJF18794.1 tetratricopeptide repeat protein [Vibrio sp. SS-MA-C1-2]